MAVGRLGARVAVDVSDTVVGVASSGVEVAVASSAVAVGGETSIVGVSNGGSDVLVAVGCEMVVGLGASATEPQPARLRSMTSNTAKSVLVNLILRVIFLFPVALLYCFRGLRRSILLPKPVYFRA